MRAKQSALTDLNVKFQALRELNCYGRVGEDSQERPRRPHQGPCILLAELNEIGKDTTGRLPLIAF